MRWRCWGGIEERVCNGIVDSWSSSLTEVKTGWVCCWGEEGCCGCCINVRAFDGESQLLSIAPGVRMDKSGSS